MGSKNPSTLWSKCILDPPSGDRVYPIPITPLPVEALPRRMLKNMQNITENTQNQKNHAFYVCFNGCPGSLCTVNRYFLSCFTMFLSPWRPNPVNYNVSGPFWGFLLCFKMFLNLGHPCPVNYNVFNIFFVFCAVLACFWALAAHAP